MVLTFDWAESEAPCIENVNSSVVKMEAIARPWIFCYCYAGYFGHHRHWLKVHFLHKADKIKTSSVLMLF